MRGRKAEKPRCGFCGTTVDLRTAVRLERNSQLWCCACYLRHDIAGRPLHQVDERAPILRVAASPEIPAQSMGPMQRRLAWAQGAAAGSFTPRDQGRPGRQS